MTVHGAELAVGVGPLVPYTHAVLLEPVHVGVATQKPQQLIYYRLQMQFLGSKQWETVVKAEAHLVAEHAHRARTRAVGLAVSLGKNPVEQVKILFHIMLFLLREYSVSALCKISLRSIGLRNGPFCTAKWAVLGCEMGHFRAQNGPFCNTLCIKVLHNTLSTMPHHRTQQSAPRASSTSENFCSATCELRMRHSAG